MKFMIGMMLLALTLNSVADSRVDHVTDAERLALTELIRQLDATLTLIEQAEHNQSADTRFPLDYDQLRSDIGLIRDGVSRHLAKPVRSPRRVPLLDGEYSHR